MSTELQDGPFEGYLERKSSRPHNPRLLTFLGEPTGWALHRKVGQYTTTPEYDTTYSVILVRRGGEVDGAAVDQYAVGYALGLEGMLVRAEANQDWFEYLDEEGEMNVEMKEIEQAADSLAEYLAERDQEQAEEDEKRFRDEEREDDEEDD